MKKKNIIYILLISAALTGFTHISYAASMSQKKITNQLKKAKISKFGPQIGGSVGFSSVKLGIVGERGISEMLSVQTGLLYELSNSNTDINKSISVLSIPIHLRINQDAHCVFIGTQLGFILHQSNNTNLLKPVSEEEKLPHRLRIGVIGGYDFEFDFGLILGANCRAEIFSRHKTASYSWLNTDFQLNVGYNLGKLLLA